MVCCLVRPMFLARRRTRVLSSILRPSPFSINSVCKFPKGREESPQELNFNIHDELYTGKQKLDTGEQKREGLSSSPSLTNRTGHFQTFRTLVDQRRSEAKKTIMVQVKSKFSAEDLYLYCSKHFGKILGMHFHQNKENASFSDFYVVEFEKPDAVTKCFDLCHHQIDAVGTASIPIYSPFLWLSGNNNNSQRHNHLAQKDEEEAQDCIPVYLPVRTDVNWTDSDIKEKLSSITSLNDQIVQFYNMSKMSDTSTRLRFLACEQIELALSGMFPKAEVLPFGSSVNTYGKFTSDLDMCVSLDPNHKLVNAENSSRLIFHAKGGTSRGQRMQVQKYCDQFSNIVQSFLPGCQNIQNILHARVPIIKYQQQLLGLDCDLSLSTTSGFHMSELLYLFGELDKRVRPLVFVVRTWAKKNALIESYRPTTFFTNFTLTLMVIFFLQNKHQMLPPLRSLHKLARPEDRYQCDDGVECNFLRDIDGYQKELNSCYETSEPSLTQLVFEFFEFYSEFDFKRHSVCVLTSELQPSRAMHSSKSQYHDRNFTLDVTNPLEPDLNVSTNIKEHAVSRLKKKCRDSMKLWSMILEEKEEKQKLFDLFNANGPETKLNIRVENLDWNSDSNVSSPTTIETPNVERPYKAVSYQEEKKNQSEKKKLRIPKVR